MRLALLISAALLAAPATTHAATTPIAQLSADAPLRGYDGTYVTSTFDGSKYQLSTFSDADPTLKPLPVPSSVAEFDADIGKGPDGRPTVIYSRCVKGSGCQLHTIALGDTAPTDLGAHINKTGYDQQTPTIDGSRIAFSRSVRNKGGASVEYGTLTGTPKALKNAFPAAGEKNGRYVGELELHGSSLATTSFYFVPDQAGQGSDDIRVINTKTGKAKVARSEVYGEGGQQPLGLSFAGGYLGWTRSCFGDEGGCGRNGNFRYRLSTGALDKGVGSYQTLTGFVLTGATSALAVKATEYPGGDCDSEDTPAHETCPILNYAGLKWKRTNAPSHQSAYETPSRTHH